MTKSVGKAGDDINGHFCSQSSKETSICLVIDEVTMKWGHPNTPTCLESIYCVYDDIYHRNSECCLKLYSPFKHSGVKWSYFKVFRAILLLTDLCLL